ncbi:MAG: D-alanine--D-alanine ligase [Acidobacteria bacterium]|nr:D-alanine--D-alanine ligase [Acidobacteriota bacterium]
MKRLRIGVVYGGRSSEHEVSLASAASIFANLDRERYEPVPLRIGRDGRWSLAERPPLLESAAETIEQARLDQTRGHRAAREVHFVAHPGDETLLTIARGETGRSGDEHRGETGRSGDEHRGDAIVNGLGLDVIFPIVHGPYGEDGTLQGLLELANVPYVGSGVLAAAAGMDKAVMKELFAARGLPIVRHEVVLRRTWRADRADTTTRLATALRFPLFVKPANLGSSVGISRAADADALPAALDVAAEFDRKIVVEEAVTPCREIECAVLGNDDPEASVPGEVITSREFYDYEAKYLDDRSTTTVPASLDPDQTAMVRRMAVDAFRAIDGAGMARVDFLLGRDDGRLFLNEINTHPGFTTISMFAKMWQASGVEYGIVLDRLIALALERHADKQQTRTSVPGAIGGAGSDR